MCRIHPGGLFDEIVEGPDVLVKLAINHEGAVAGDLRRDGAVRGFLRLVRMAEQEFPGRQRRPLLSENLAAADGVRLIAVDNLPVDERLSYCIPQPEMLERPRLEGSVGSLLRQRRCVLIVSLARSVAAHDLDLVFRA